MESGVGRHDRDAVGGERGGCRSGDDPQVAGVERQDVEPADEPSPPAGDPHGLEDRPDAHQRGRGGVVRGDDPGHEAGEDCREHDDVEAAVRLGYPFGPATRQGVPREARYQSTADGGDQQHRHGDAGPGQEGRDVAVLRQQPMGHGGGGKDGKKHQPVA
jgi:hypothetical protein